MVTGMWALILSTDFASKLVLLTLLSMSIVCWALLLFKKRELQTKCDSMAHAYSVLGPVKSVAGLKSRLALLQHAFAGELLAELYQDMQHTMNAQASSMSDTEWARVQAVTDQRIDDEVALEESLLPVLSISATVSPLIGLFGTVWGLIHAFMAIAEQKTADIAAVAPGIAEALLTTLAGLLVAIPALVMYGYLMRSVREFERLLIKLVDKQLWIVRSVAPAPVVQVASLEPKEKELQ